MRALAGIGGLILLLVVLWDGFETIVLPRRVTRLLRLARLFYRATWMPWSALARRFPRGDFRETMLGVYGPLSLLLLLALWAAGLVVGFGVLQWSFGSRLADPSHGTTFASDLYYSGTSFFTLGLGDVTPRSVAARALTVVESGTGFGFLALTIGYLPVLYQAFSRRERSISLLDARAGSPPSAVELLRRHSRDGSLQEVDRVLREWEEWAAELLESHLSYPVLGFFRSQHEHQSWLAAITAILDTSALVLAGVQGIPEQTARFTFRLARHAVVDLAQVFRTPPRDTASSRLQPADSARLRSILSQAGIGIRDGDGFEQRLTELRRLYEPYVVALAGYLELSLPAWIPAAEPVDDWESSAWMPAER